VKTELQNTRTYPTEQTDAINLKVAAVEEAMGLVEPKEVEPVEKDVKE